MFVEKKGEIFSQALGKYTKSKLENLLEYFYFFL